MNTNNFIVQAIDSETLEKEFLQFPVRLYKKQKYWIRPLDKDVKNVFDPGENKLFRQGEAARWILKDSGNKPVGRIAAFIDYKTAENNDQPTGGIGFFECINNQEAANLLFDTSKNWLTKRGMEAMDGPVNFGDRDRWWGCLVKGFDAYPNYCMPYNFPYYQELFENYGFKNYFDQYTYYRVIEKKGLDPIIEEKAERIFSNHNYTFCHLDKKKIEKFTEDFRIIYNKAWSRHKGVKAISKIHANALMKSLKPIMDERLMWFAYYKDEPIAFFLMIPEINTIIKHLNGKMDLMGKIKFLIHKLLKSCDKVLGLVFGVVPEHQGKGIEGGIIMSFGEVALSKDFHYKHLELNWIGDFNPTMIKVVEQVGCSIIKVHTTFRYLFDRDKPFIRAKRL